MLDNVSTTVVMLKVGDCLLLDGTLTRAERTEPYSLPDGGRYVAGADYMRFEDSQKNPATQVYFALQMAHAGDPGSREHWQEKTMRRLSELDRATEKTAHVALIAQIIDKVDQQDYPAAMKLTRRLFKAELTPQADCAALAVPLRRMAGRYNMLRPVQAARG